MLTQNAFKSPWRVFGRVALLVGALLFVPALVLFIVWRASDSGEGLAIAALALGGNGALWLILGTCFSLLARRVSKKLKRLEREGVRYEAEIVRLAFNHHIRIGANLTTYVECSYRDRAGKTCLVKSALFLMDGIYGKEDLNAVVYVSRGDPRDYAVEITAVSGSNGAFDFDYR